MIRLETASTCSIEECNASFGLRFVKIKPDVGMKMRGGVILSETSVLFLHWFYTTKFGPNSIA